MSIQFLMVALYATIGSPPGLRPRNHPDDRFDSQAKAPYREHVLDAGNLPIASGQECVVSLTKVCRILYGVSEAAYLRSYNSIDSLLLLYTSVKRMRLLEALLVNELVR